MRIRLKAAGTERAIAVETAWQEMWAKFQPLLERINAPAPGFIGYQGDIDDVLDPNYSEPDPGKWLRDGLIWTAAEIRRVVTDSHEGTTVDLSRAATPPPTAWAIFCLESFARKPPGKRGELIARVLPFATRSHDTPDTPERDEDRARGFLDDID